MTMLLGLIFDLDGTLVDSAADLRQALNTLLTAHDRRALSLLEVKQMVGDGLQTMLDRAFTATGSAMPSQATSTLFNDFLRIYQSQISTTELLYPHTVETIKKFRNARIRIGLCTNKLYLPTTKLLSDIGITDLFDFVAGSDTFSVYKPHPGHVLGVAKALEAAPANCVMIGDSLNDIRAAQGAGVPSIAVTHGYGIGDLGADASIDSFLELLEALRHLGFDVSL